MVRSFYLRHEVGVITFVAAIVYTACALWLRVALLNWITGPAWFVVWVWAAPPLVRRATGWNDTPK